MELKNMSPEEAKETIDKCKSNVKKMQNKE
jgi:hypothetical protein